MHAVIFDIDGTLLRSSATDDALYRESVASVLGSVQFRRHLSDYEHVSDSGILAQIFEDNGLIADPSVIDAVRDDFFRRIDTYIRTAGPFEELPHARKILRRLRKSGHHAVAIATGSWQRSAQTKLCAAGFDLDGIPLASSDDAIERTDIMRHALARLGREFHAVTYYGDGLWDEAACDRLGWEFRAVGPELGGIESFEHEFLD